MKLRNKLKETLKKPGKMNKKYSFQSFAELYVN
jgi:hypothetical protein